MPSLTKPLLRLVLAVAFVLPVVVLVNAAEDRFELGPNAVFGLLMLGGVVSALLGEWIVRSRTRTDRGRDDSDR